MATSEEKVTSATTLSPTTGFTAVNGAKEQAPVQAPAQLPHGIGGPRRGSDERSNGQPRITPPGQEKLTITTTSHDCPPLTNGERHPYQQPNYHEVDASHKRKRSGSCEQNSAASTFHSHNLPSATPKQTPSTAITEPDIPRESREDIRGPPAPATQLDPRDAHNPESQYRGAFLQSPGNGRDHPPPAEPWHSRHYGHHSQMTSDEQIGEALQRDLQQMDAQQRGGPSHHYSPEYDSRSANPYDEYGHDRREDSAISDAKKRKRNFSNRTKTGCMTCRKRKKKCDEAKPECSNCIRGGFVCTGYQQQRAWPKTEQKQAPIPLQSKIEYENSPYSRETSYMPQHLSGPPRREPLPGYRGQNLRVDPPHGRNIQLDDEAVSATAIPSASVASPDNNRLSAISYSQQTPTPITATSSAYPDRQLKNVYERMGPLHDASRQEPRSEADTGPPQSATSSMPQILHPRLQSDSPHTNPQNMAQLALSNLTSTISRQQHGSQRTQKEEMLSGRHYFPFDKELVLERERCNGACWRFNSSTNPNNGVSPEERSRLFRDILQPRDQVISPSAASPVTPVGRVGDNVIVEAPFNCDYGYNISIGQDVAIGKNCTILDTCEVTIGDRCNIGPNVSIYTATLPIDPKRRLGSRGPNLGRRITIESDCWIGGGVTILPGRTIGTGSTVGAGSVVTRDVPKYTVVCGNPATVRRGVHPSHEH